MSAPAYSKRKFWQFHLSTAIVLMLTAGALIGLNLKQTNGKITQHYAKDDDGRFADKPEAFVSVVWEYHEQGWPISFYTFVDLGMGQDKGTTSIRYLIADCGICIVILASIAFISEWFIRRREARKP